MYHFGRNIISKSQVFYETLSSYCLVNLKPLVPGHVLIVSKNKTDRVMNLTVEETTDLWLTARKVAEKLEPYYKASAFTFAIQDGKDAGQTVPQVHIHVIPRTPRDIEPNDKVYKMLEDEERKARTLDEMSNEAEELRKLFD
ncbi:HIT-like protein [Conidiobolus coronatus NRRL 28638]|uniref:Bis(5'-adenosyl)-triphosphatase n=1 Tax=Conidiobolus coronatus (strain ATCC 28846 / CBS 209.66 / NRRL 28638) TaxID=796925 RepID=A0A137PHW0_CONC2|nr:HIT-like protein [Conidiobolus coronatus NRRL 28638]|eukprot:KXN74586.1 HIT-like protein [Conidiobolus coronatus NRRL 28638]